jgi:hypothetical protein
MAPDRGNRRGPYEILALLRSAGVGAVHRARTASKGSVPVREFLKTPVEDPEVQERRLTFRAAAPAAGPAVLVAEADGRFVDRQHARDPLI